MKHDHSAFAAAQRYAPSRAEVEDRIRAETERAEAALQDSPLTHEGVAGLCALAHAVSWRTA